MCARLLTVAFAVSLLAPPHALAEELDALAQAIESNPEDAKAYDSYGAAAIGKNRLDDAIAKLKLGVARCADFPRGYYLLAYAFRKKQAWADAADNYRVYIALRPTEIEPWFGLGKSLAGMGDKKGAITAFKKYVSLENRPQNKRYVEEAQGEIAKLEPPPSADPGALKAEADALKAQGKLDEAATAYRKAIDADKSNLQLYTELGNVFFSLKRYGDAAQVFKEATGRDPNYAFGWYNLAMAYRKTDRRQDAVEAYHKYMQLKPEDPDPYYGLGQTLKGMNDYAAAITSFRKYVEMERRADQQKWVEKAKQELQALEALVRPAAEPGKMLDEKAVIDGLGAPPTATPTAPTSPMGMPRDRDDLMPFDAAPRRPGLRDLHDPFQDAPADETPQTMPDGLINPFGRSVGPYGSLGPSLAPSLRAPRVARAREYGQAVAAYRRALAAHVEDVSTRYERGVASALAGRPVDAVAAWDNIRLDDGRIVQARRTIEQFRSDRQ